MSILNRAVAYNNKNKALSLSVKGVTDSLAQFPYRSRLYLNEYQFFTNPADISHNYFITYVLKFTFFENIMKKCYAGEITKMIRLNRLRA